jgi:hypothetical protein
MKMPGFAKFLIVMPALLLSGCATSVWDAKWGPDKPHISYASLESGGAPLDKLYVWNPNNNAAYVFPSTATATVACIASADVAKARNHESGFKIDLGNILDKIESTKIEETLKVIDSVTKLSDKGEAASFLNVAMFHICMMAGSGKITPSEANSLLGKAIDKAAEMTKPAK